MTMAYLRAGPGPRKSVKSVVTDQINFLCKQLELLPNQTLYMLVEDTFAIGDDTITCATMEAHQMRIRLKGLRDICDKMDWHELKARCTSALKGP